MIAAEARASKLLLDVRSYKPSAKPATQLGELSLTVFSFSSIKDPPFNEAPPSVHREDSSLGRLATSLPARCYLNYLRER